MQSKKQKQLRLNNYELIDGLLKDDVAVTGKPETQLIEEILISHYTNAKHFPLLKVMYIDKANMGCVLSGVWCDAAIGYSEDWLDVVHFAAVQSQMGNNLPDKSRDELHHFIGLLESLYLYLQTLYKKKNNPDTKNDMEWIAKIIEIYKSANKNTGLHSIYQVIINNWNYLKSLTKVYNLLQSMAEMQTAWVENPSARIELLQLLKKQRV